MALVIAVVLAAVATVALVSYVQGLRDDAFEGAETVQVFIAKDNIPAGVSGDSAIQQGLIERGDIPRKVVATGAITSLEQIKGRVAAVNILQGEQIVLPRFVAPGQASGAVLPIPKDLVAMSVEVELVPGVAGFVKQGDRVGVLAELTVPRGGGGATEVKTQFLLRGAQVLAVGRRVVTTTPEGRQQEQTQQSQDRVLLTLALPPTQAERLGYAIFQGRLHFVLLPPGARQVPRTQGQTSRTIL